MNTQPILPLIVLVPILLAVIGLIMWVCVKSLAKAPAKAKKWILALRLVALLGLAVILINPGEWKTDENSPPTEWAVMLDTSASMDVEELGEKRIAQAEELLEKIQKHGEEQGVNIKVFPYDSKLKSESIKATKHTADGENSLFEESADQLISKYKSSASPLSGVVVLSDGRQTTNSEASNFFMKAKSSAISFHSYTIGKDYLTPDVAVQSPYKMVSAFGGQRVQITAHLSISHSKQRLFLLELLNEDGEVVDSKQVDFKDWQSLSHSFSIIAPDKSTIYKVRTAKIDGEIRLANNETEVNVRILSSKTKVFIAEGAPYWDSKFFAQLLRQQKHMDVTAVYRLSNTRWFMIDSESAKPYETTNQVFPEAIEDLRKYDLIVFGKNIDGFMTPQIAANLRLYVREHGGAVLFARGKSFTSDLSDLKSLEPLKWKNSKVKKFTMSPTTEGANVGLFGQALPAKGSSVWTSLPPLQDAHYIDSVKPFTRVLATGKSGRSEFPLLMVRRYGQGVAGLINADGLWKWDFFPKVKSQGNMYNEFWGQLIQWMVSYSEFLPGYKHSVHLSSTNVQPDKVVSVRVGYRGDKVLDKVKLEIHSESLTTPQVLFPAKSIAQDGRVEWKTSVKFDQPGSYKVKLLVDSDTPLPETSFVVEEPPSEFDELSADADFMKTIAIQTGGESLGSENFEQFLKTNVVVEKASIENGRVTWSPYWLHWLVALAFVVLLASEWWMRRRNGLM